MTTPTRIKLNDPNQANPNARKALAYSLDALIPGFYLWVGSWVLRMGGSEAEESYSGSVHSSLGIAVIFPNYRIWSTYQGSFAA